MAKDDFEDYLLTKMHRLRHLLIGLSGSLLVLILDAACSVTPSFAAETISFRYGVLQRSLPVQDLQTYAETQEASPELKTFLRSLSDDSQNTVQTALQLRLPLDVVTVDRALRTEYGQKVLSELAQVIERDDDAVVQALRAGLVLGSRSPGGLGVLSFLEAYPSQTITINVPEAINFVQRYEQLLRRAPGVRSGPEGQ